MYKVKNGIAPDSIGNLFNICDNQNYSLRRVFFPLENSF